MTNPKSANNALLDIKAAVRSTSLCSDKTVQHLKRLLVPTENLPSSHNSAAESAQRNLSKTPAPAGSKRNAPKATKQPNPVDIYEDQHPALSERQRLALATDVVNSALQALGDAVRFPCHAPATHVDRHKTKPGLIPNPTPRSKLSGPARPNRGFREVSSNHASTSPGEAIVGAKSPALGSGNGSQNAGLEALVECARIAFEHLRRANPVCATPQDPAEWQIEHGMIAFIGKLVGLRLGNSAAKELKCLKRRLEMRLEQRADDRSPIHASSSPAMASSDATRRETLANLLHFEIVDLSPPCMHFVVTYQILVLRAIGINSRPNVIESLKQHIALTSPYSPLNLILRYIEATRDNERATVLLEQLSQVLLSLCPKLSSANDASATDASKNGKPATCFLLQSLAFRARLSWMALSDHKGSIEEEILHPYSKCLAAFERRSSESNQESYWSAKESFDLFLNGLAEMHPNLTDDSSTISEKARNLYLQFSRLAEQLNLHDEAQNWLKRLLPDEAKDKASSVEQCTLACRIAIVNLTQSAQTKCPVDLEVLHSALALMRGRLTGNAEMVDHMMHAILDLRKMAANFLKLNSRASESMETAAAWKAHQPCREIISSCVFLQAQLYKATLGGIFQCDAAKSRHRREQIIKSAKASIEAVVFGYIQLNDSDADTWASADDALRICAGLVQAIRDCPVGEDGLATPCALPQLLVSLSNAYFRLYAKSKDQLPEKSLTSLDASCEILRGASPQEKSDANLITKLERLARAFQVQGRFRAARQLHLRLMETWCELRCFAKNPCPPISKPSAWKSDPQLALVRDCLRCLLEFEAQTPLGLPHDQPFFDDKSLQSDDRGALLEWQLALVSDSATSKVLFAYAVKIVVPLAMALYHIYAESTHPVQRKRISLQILDLATDRPECVPASLLTYAEESAASEYTEELCASANTERLSPALKLALATALVIRSSPLGEDRLQDAIAEWSQILESSSSWAELAYGVDECGHVFQRLSSLSEFLGSKGRPYLQLAASRLAFKLHEHSLGVSNQGFIKASVDFGLQLLRLGYSELAGIYFAKAQAQMDHALPSLGERIDYHLVYAEYFLSLGDRTQCSEHVGQANMLLNELESTLLPHTGEAARHDKVINISRNADLLHLRSRLCFETGSFLQAFWFAKQEVILLQSAWKSLEIRNKASRQNKKPVEDEGSDLIDALSQLDISGDELPHRTKQAAGFYGPSFWPLMPRLCNALVHLSGLYQCSGLLSDAMYNLDQALQLAEGNTADHSLASVLVQKGDCGCRGGSAEASWEYLDRANKVLGGSIQIKDAAILQQSIGHFHHLQREWMTEINAYDLAESILTTLVHPDFVRLLEGKSNPVDSPGTVPSDSKTGAVLLESQAGKRTERSRQTSKVIRKPKKSPQRNAAARPQSPVQFSSFSKLHNDLTRVKAESLLLQGNLDASAKLISSLRENSTATRSVVEQRICHSRQLLCEAVKILSADGIFGMIAESAISFPGAALSSPKSHNVTKALEGTSKQEHKSHGQSHSRAKLQAQSNTVHNFRQLLGQSLQGLSMKRAITDQLCALSVLRQASSTISAASMMLSSVEPVSVDHLLHPALVGYSTDLPQCIASLRDQAVTYVDKIQKDTRRGVRLLRDFAPVDTLRPPEISQFSGEFIDCIPMPWTVISVSLDESQSHLHLTRYRRNQCPFVLRLPLTRQNAEDPDEESFTFAEAKTEFSNIVELSDATVHAAKEDADGMKKKSAKAQWWAEREALDGRLHDFLLNIENMWLGGFRGIFSNHHRDLQLLARFQQTFEMILEKHLPSRQKSRKRDAGSQVQLDPQVLDLFVGLINSLEDIENLDETLTDLLYFVVDILQFNGEANAYDEIDFDSIIIETQDALRSYYEASQAEPIRCSSGHTILVLEKQLHGIPWESLPCLAGSSVSRVYSLIELQERFSLIRQQSSVTSDKVGVFASASHGTYILNPSGDLKKTQSRFEKQLSRLSHSSQGWTAIANRDPTEDEFAIALHATPESTPSAENVQEPRNRVLLYFGHGSGTQYIRHRRIKQLRFQHQSPSHRLMSGSSNSSPDYSDVSSDFDASTTDDINNSPAVDKSPSLMNPEISATLLFGCSSASLRQNLEFEPHGTPKSYMLTGAPALLGSLWDVTDGDVDKFAGGVLERWGLFEDGAFAELRREGAKGRSKGGACKAKSKESRPTSRSADGDQVSSEGLAMSLTEAVAKSRGDCYLKYLNGAAMVVYGVPVYLAKSQT